MQHKPWNQAQAASRIRQPQPGSAVAGWLYIIDTSGSMALRREKAIFDPLLNQVSELIGKLTKFIDVAITCGACSNGTSGTRKVK